MSGLPISCSTGSAGATTSPPRARSSSSVRRCACSNDVTPCPAPTSPSRRPRSYAVHPARTARPQVLVKRAVAAEPGPIGVTERITDDPDAVAPVAASASRPSPSPAAPGAVARPPRRPPVGRRVRPSRRVRGLLLLAAVAELLVIVPLVAFSLLPLWALAPALLAVGCGLPLRPLRCPRRAGPGAGPPSSPGRPGPPSRRGAGRPARRRACAGRPPPRHPPAVPRPSGARPRRRGRRAVAAVEAADDATVSEPALVGADSPVVEPVAAQAVVPAEPAPTTSWCRSSTRTTSRSPGTPCRCRARPTR